MDKNIIKFDDTETEKYTIYQNKSSISINNIDINKIVPNKVPFHKQNFKYFIGYKYGKRVRPLRMFLPKMSACRKDFDETKYMSFLIKNNQLLEKYN